MWPLDYLIKYREKSVKIKWKITLSHVSFDFVEWLIIDSVPVKVTIIIAIYDVETTCVNAIFHLDRGEEDVCLDKVVLYCCAL